VSVWSLYVSTNGNLYVTNLQTNNLDYFVNYGNTNISNLTVFSNNCKIENENYLNISGGLDNYSNHVINVNRFVVSGNTNNNGTIVNLHLFDIAGNYNNNNTSNLINDCRISIAGNINQNGYLENNAYININGTITFNNLGQNIMGPQSLLTCVNTHINTTIQGPDVNCAKIDISGTTNINSNGNILNYMDICDENGIEINNGHIDNTVTFCECYIPTSDCNPGSGEPGNGDDSDNDGCPDDVDEYPNDPERCSNDYYPSENKFATLAFEDLWNSTGDYDFNDLVVNFNYKTVKNAQNKVVEIFAKYHVAAIGASLNNGFGIEFSTPTKTIDSVTGNVIVGNAFNIGENGAEEGPLNKAVVIIFDALNNYAETSMVNTVPGGNKKEFDTIEVYIKFNRSVADMGQAPFNPFMIIDQERGKETHLIDNEPTELVNMSYFGQNSDDSDPAAGRYYVTETNLPWVIEIPETFDWPKEQADILTAYLKFQEWAESSGSEYPDWYKDKTGYRNPQNIYITATK
jgi:LruC domain-containing protein